MVLHLHGMVQKPVMEVSLPKPLLASSMELEEDFKDGMLTAVDAVRTEDDSRTQPDPVRALQALYDARCRRSVFLAMNLPFLSRGRILPEISIACYSIAAEAVCKQQERECIHSPYLQNCSSVGPPPF